MVGMYRCTKSGGIFLSFTAVASFVNFGKAVDILGKVPFPTGQLDLYIVLGVG